MATRTKKTLINASTEVFTIFLTYGLQFINRTFFIRFLGIQYAGVSGLFTSIFSTLSLAELGFGTAMTYALYKPLKDKDTAKLTLLMNFYRKIYLAIGMVILVAGCCVIPFLNRIVTEVPNIRENIVIIYLLYLFEVVLTYLFGYRASIVEADQNGYKITVRRQLMKCISLILEIIVLALTKRFLLYLGCIIIVNLATQVWIYCYSLKMYPNNPRVKGQELALEEKKNIFKNVKSIFGVKIFSVADNVGSIVISAFVGTIEVGLLSNYNTIVLMVRSIVKKVFRASMPSVGNVVASLENKDRYFLLFKEMSFASHWIAGFVSVSLLVLLDPFITIWLGDGFTMPFIVRILLVANLYLRICHYPVGIFSEAHGKFKEICLPYIMSGLLNVVLALLFVQLWGTSGVLSAIIVSYMCTAEWFETKIVIKKLFNQSIFKYYLRYFLYVVVAVGIYILTEFICDGIPFKNLWLSFALKLVICCVVVNGIFLIINFRSDEFKNLFKRLKGVLKIK